MPKSFSVCSFFLNPQCYLADSALNSIASSLHLSVTLCRWLPCIPALPIAASQHAHPEEYPALPYAYSLRLAGASRCQQRRSAHERDAQGDVQGAGCSPVAHAWLQHACWVSLLSADEAAEGDVQGAVCKPVVHAGELQVDAHAEAVDEAPQATRIVVPIHQRQAVHQAHPQMLSCNQQHLVNIWVSVREIAYARSHHGNTFDTSPGYRLEAHQPSLETCLFHEGKSTSRAGFRLLTR